MKALLEEEADKIPIEEEIENQVIIILYWLTLVLFFQSSYCGSDIFVWLQLHMFQPRLLVLFALFSAVRFNWSFALFFSVLK